MSDKYKLTKLFKKKAIIPVCMVSQEEFNAGKRDTLEFRLGDTWITAKPPFEYKRYTHGICNGCIKDRYPTIYQSMVEAGKIIDKQK